MIKHKSFIIGALTTSITWIIAIYLYNKLTTSNKPGGGTSEHFTKLPVAAAAKHETWRQAGPSKFEVGQIKTIEEKFKRDAGYEQHSFNVIVSERIGIVRDIPDTRNEKCDKTKYNIPTNTSISVIMCFYNEHLQTLLRSVSSVIQRTPPGILKEILLIDDYSNLPNDGLFDGIVSLEPNKKIQIMRNSQRQGLIRSRVFGARLAKGDIIVFLDSHIEVNTGWIEALIHPIVEDSTVVTIPIVDLIDPDTFEYSPSPLVKGGFNWGLHFKWDQLPSNNVTDPTELIKSATMPGGLFAINRKFFKTIGEFDTGMEIWGGENLEISFRLWMCGGSMFIVPCSRVGHVFRKRRPYGSLSKDDTLLRNNLRLAYVWLDNYKEYFLKTFKNPPTMEFGNIQDRIALRKSLNCKSFEWYHKNVYPDMVIPGNKTLQKSREPMVQPWYLRKRNYIKNFAIQCSTSMLCLTNLSKRSKDSVKKGDTLTLQKCSGKPNQEWYLTDKNELILNQLLCLETRFAKEGSGSSFLSKCHESGTDQEWKLLENESNLFSIYNKASGMCLLPTNGKVGDTIDVAICGESSKSGIWKILENAS